MTNDGSLTARDIAVIPPVSGQDNVQDALTAGGGGGGGFPVGPFDDGTSTFLLRADPTELQLVQTDNASGTNVDWDGSIVGPNDANTSIGVNGQGLTAATLTAEIVGGQSSDVTVQLDGSEVARFQTDLFALSADDGTNTYAIAAIPGTNGQILVSVTDDATGNMTGVIDLGVESDTGSAQLRTGSTNHAVGISAQASETAGRNGIFGQVDGVDAVTITAMSVTFDPAVIPEGDPHIDRALFTVGYVQGVTAGTLMISAG